MRYTFARAEDGDAGHRNLVWHSEPFGKKGTREVVFCDEVWFWACTATRRWTIANELAVAGGEPGFHSYRQTPVDGTNYNDCLIS